MGGSHRLAAVAAVSHARHYYNLTQPDVVQAESTQYNVNIFFVSATICGVLVAVCAACWPRAPAADKPEDSADYPRGVYTVSGDMRVSITQTHEEIPEPPPAYDMVVDGNAVGKDIHLLQEVVTEPSGYSLCQQRPDSGLPTYEAAVMLKDTKL